MFFMPLPWGLRVTLVVCGFWGLFCFGLPGPRFFSFVVGVGLGFGLVFWAVVLTLGSGWLFVVGWGLICWFCLESLILAQDERWRRA